MAKVKKPARVTGERNTRKPGKRKTGAGKAAARLAGKSSKPAKQAAPKKKTAQEQKTASRKKVVEKKTVVAIKELDPQLKCGPDTSVQFLYRVDELVDGKRTPHLVFYDHHGWYCEHGRTCPAVGHAKKHNGQFARAS